MNDLREQILFHSTAEYLAKQNEFAGDSMEPYFAQAETYHRGNISSVSKADHDAITIHGLMAQDQESEVLAMHPELAEDYAASDRGQIKGARSKRNVQHFMQHGIGYTLDMSQIERVRSLATPDQPLTSVLMREKIIRLNGFDSRINYAYHDTLDHLWLFNFVQQQGLSTKYIDFFNPTGYPFDGFLFSKQAELISGIGFNARLYTSDPEHYATLALDPEVIADHLQEEGNTRDSRVQEAIQTLGSRDDIASYAGFVIKGAIANILAQRRKYGAVKRLEVVDGELHNSGEVVPLFDPLYLSFMVETVTALADNNEAYRDTQTRLNLVMESALSRFVRLGEASGTIVLDDEIDVTGISPRTISLLKERVNLSTNYF